jgi:hypothetical protein
MQDQTQEHISAEHLVHQLIQERTKLLNVVDRLESERELYPGWTIKHFVAHLTGWDEATTASLQAHMGGKEPGTPAIRGINFYNEQSVATRTDLNYYQVRRECEIARAELCDVLKKLPQEKIEQELIFPWGSDSGSVPKLIAILLHHDNHHTDELQQLIADDANETNKRNE